MREDIVLSADSHIVEPADLWSTRIDAQYRERAPRVVRQLPNLPEGDWFVCENLRPFPVSGFAVAGVDPKDFGKSMLAGYPGVRPGAWDPAQRMKDQDIDGVAGEVIYPSLAMMLYGIKDGGLRAASFKAYNNWLAEFCGHAPKRLAGAFTEFHRHAGKARILAKLLQEGPDRLACTGQEQVDAFRRDQNRAQQRIARA